jgi:hypothetical protein
MQWGPLDKVLPKIALGRPPAIACDTKRGILDGVVKANTQLLSDTWFANKTASRKILDLLIVQNSHFEAPIKLLFELDLFLGWSCSYDML